MSFPRYPEYKDSGVEWLGAVPRHWRVLRIKHLLKSLEQGWSPQCEAIPVDSPDEWGVLKVGCVNGGVFNAAENKALPPELEPIPDLGIRAADLLISRANTRELVGSAAVALVDHSNLMLCDKLFRLRFDASVCSPHFIASYLSTGKVRGQIELAASGASSSMLNIGQSTILEMAVALPDSTEQVAICDFLRRETAKIDNLMAEQEKLIALLKEKRQAVISHAVTKGLDPTAPMKDSRIEWLGEVPAHWGQPQKLLNVARKEQHSFVNGPFGSDLLSSELVTEGIPVVYIRDIKEKGYTRVSEWCVTPEKSQELKFCNVLPGDIIIAKVGNPPGLAAVYPLGEPEAIVTQDVIRLRLDPKQSRPEYIKWLLNSDYGRALIDDISVESTRTRVGLGEYKQLRFFMPSVPEQNVAADFLERETAALDLLVNEAALVIDLLKERRTALISAAVTGQIDVRGLVKEEQEQAA